MSAEKKDKENASQHDLKNKLKSLAPASALALEVPMDKYFDLIAELIDNFAKTKNLECIYLLASLPSSTMINALEALSVDTARIRFIDCVTRMVFGEAAPSGAIDYIERPTMLENIILKVDYFMRKNTAKNPLVIIDSINALEAHNGLGILSEFLQVLLNMLRSKGAHSVLMFIKEQTKDEAREMLSLLVDEYVDFS